MRERRKSERLREREREREGGGASGGSGKVTQNKVATIRTAMKMRIAIRDYRMQTTTSHI